MFSMAAKKYNEKSAAKWEHSWTGRNKKSQIGKGILPKTSSEQNMWTISESSWTSTFSSELEHQPTISQPSANRQIFRTSSQYQQYPARGGRQSHTKKLVGEFGCCKSRMAERICWWTEKWLELWFLSGYKYYSCRRGLLVGHLTHNCWM